MHLSPAGQPLPINLVRRAARADILPRFLRLSEADIGTKSGPQDLVTHAGTAAAALIVEMSGVIPP
ncbi:hypothetical protein [Rhodosalinus sp. FB01]|uniref:hypothetical protein n=1 Tax=Rhodosalinus sp. FB01 TaxID=3239194 RepID=UPI0035232135